MSTNDKHLQKAKGLRELADFIEANPDLAHLFTYFGRGLNVFARGENPAAELAAVLRAGKRAGAAVEKNGDKTFFWVAVEFSGGVSLHMNSSREEVCERVVVGTETVTKTVPDPEKLAEVPTVEITETVEKTEWRCGSLLAAEQDSAVSR